MGDRFVSGIGLKLFLVVCVVLLVMIVPLSMIVLKTLDAVGGYAAQVNREKILELSEAYSVHVAHEQAARNDAFFRNVANVSAALASRAANIYEHQDYLIRNPLVEDQLSRNPESGIFFNDPSRPVVTAYWGGPRLTDEVRDELRALSHLKPDLVKAKAAIPESVAAHAILMSGIGLYCTTNPEAREAVFGLPPVSIFDLRDGAPVTVITDSQERPSKTCWTSPYKDDVIDGLMVTATTPIVDRQGVFRGITGVDIPLTSITETILSGRFDLKTTTASPMFAFLVDDDTRLIAFPEAYLKPFGLDVDMSRFEYSDDIMQHTLLDSTVGGVQRFAARLRQDNAGDTSYQLTLDGDEYILSVGHLKTLGWHYVTVAPTSALMSSVRQTSLAMEKTSRIIVKKFLQYSGLVVLLVILILAEAVRRFVQPIHELTASTGKVAEGDYSVRSAIRRNDEIGTLSDSFNTMVGRLDDARRREKEYSSGLEAQIRERTAELEAANQRLRQARDTLEEKVAKRTRELRELNEYLLDTEERTRRQFSIDLHDSAGQILAMTIARTKGFLEKGEPVDSTQIRQMLNDLEDVIRQIRALSFDLSPPILKDFPLPIAIGWLTEEMNARHDVVITYINDIDDRLDLGDRLTEALFRSLKELINNVLRHARAREVWVRIFREPEGALAITVEDDGIGFDTHSLDSRRSWSMGLFSISEQMKQYQGECRIESIPGEGTTITLRVPLSN